jgi:hypothetical protein
MTFTVEPAAIGWRVIRSDGEVMGEGLTNSQAWALVDRLDQDAIRMENTRRRIADAVSEIEL